MPTLTQAATSTLMVWQQVEETDLSGNQLNPSADPVSMAFAPMPQYGLPANPADGDYHTAIWGITSDPVTYWSGILVGPANGGLVLAKGAYVIAVKVVDSPEVPCPLWGWTLMIT